MNTQYVHKISNVEINIAHEAMPNASIYAYISMNTQVYCVNNV